MSWWVSLEKDSKICQVPLFEEGGTHAIGGQDEAELNVTYNYGKYFAFNYLDGRTGNDVIPVLTKRVMELGTVRDDDYWKSTQGNAGYALNILLGWATLHPDGIFRVC